MWIYLVPRECRREGETNMTNLADRYAAAHAAHAAAVAALDALKAEVKALSQEVLEGDYCFVELALSERVILDAKKASSFLTPEQVASCQKKSLVETIRVKAKVPAALAA
jgi:hypothetical protein